MWLHYIRKQKGDESDTICVGAEDVGVFVDCSYKSCLEFKLVM